MADGFFVRMVNSDCLADKFGGWLEISISRHRGWLRGSNRRRSLTHTHYTLHYHIISILHPGLLHSDDSYSYWAIPVPEGTVMKEGATTAVCLAAGMKAVCIEHSGCWVIDESK